MLVSNEICLIFKKSFKVMKGMNFKFSMSLVWLKGQWKGNGLCNHIFF